jgi:hypothetical protein
MPVRLEDRVSRLAQKVKLAKLVRHARESLLHGRRIEVCPSLITPATGTPTASATSRSNGARSAAVLDNRLRASNTSPERQSRTTQSTSWPTSGCKPSIARITRPWPASSPRSRPLSVSDTARSSS